MMNGCSNPTDFEAIKPLKTAIVSGASSIDPTRVVHLDPASWVSAFFAP